MAVSGRSTRHCLTVIRYQIVPPTCTYILILPFGGQQRAASGPAHRRLRGAECSNFRVLGERECVLDVDSEVANGFLDLALTGKDLDDMQNLGRPVVYGSLGSPM